jgi:ribosomal protein S18 acetylase RimI-like enzyme
MAETATSITLRYATPADDVFLFELYASTRGDELTAVSWNEQQREIFLRSQFNVQQRTYPDADNQIILLNEREVGRILTKRTQESVLLVDISILPEFRNRGIGTKLIKDLFREATDSAKSIRLHVLASNAARRLYERLGFVAVDAESSLGAQAYVEMIWLPTVTS